MAKKNESIHRINKVIGERIQEMRVSMGMSRIQLSSKIEVTHQQLQNYEKGINRISAGRLVLIAWALKKPVSFFFEDIEKEQEALPTQHQRMCIEVSRNFLRVKNPMHQNAINLLVRTLSEKEK